MFLLNAKVKHKLFGIGTVVKIEGEYITVDFLRTTTKFKYPGAFESFIRAVDDNVQDQIIADIENAKKEAEDVKRLEKEQKAAEAAQKAAEEEAKRASITKKTGYTPKPVPVSQRIEGKRMIFWVFQGKSFDKEFQGGYIWAPTSNKSGTTPHHWTRLVDVRKGDIILHGCDGMLKAISVARDVCFECKQPRELEVEDLWDADGRMVECDYVSIENPIKTATFVNDIIRLCQVKYSPFDKYGNGNMGYLFEINRELAKIFVAETVRKNQYLAAIEYIDELLAEDKNG